MPALLFSMTLAVLKSNLFIPNHTVLNSHDKFKFAEKT
jgi:hypothetical protein